MQGLSSDCSQDIGRVRSHLKACLELEIQFQEGSLTRLLAKVLSSSYGRWQEASGPCHLSLLNKLLEYPDDVATNSPQNELSKRKQ